MDLSNYQIKTKTNVHMGKGQLSGPFPNFKMLKLEVLVSPDAIYSLYLYISEGQKTKISPHNYSSCQSYSPFNIPYNSNSENGFCRYKGSLDIVSCC